MADSISELKLDDTRVTSSTLALSVMRSVTTFGGPNRPEHAHPRLSMGRITGEHRFETFLELAEHVLIDLRFPTPQADKMQSFGWTPTLFETSVREFLNPFGGVLDRKLGHWRRGEAEIDQCSVLVCDVDNAVSTLPLVTMDEVMDNLGRAGIEAFGYTSFSHTVTKPKFRIVISIDRGVTRAEALCLFIWANQRLFDEQGDPAIYDPGDFIFGPPHEGGTFLLQGDPLPVAGILSEPTNKALLARYTAARIRSKVRPLTFEERARIADLSVRDDLSVNNPRICRPEWVSEYQACGSASGSHWETIRRIMGRVWLKNHGELSRGDMESLFDELDLYGGGYFAQHHGTIKRADIIGFIMRRPAPPREEPPNIEKIMEKKKARQFARLASFNPPNN